MYIFIVTMRIYVYVSVMLIYRVRYRYIIYRSVRYDAYLTIYRVRKGIYKEILERVREA